MATFTHTKLYQGAPAADTNITAYTVPAATRTQFNSIIVCNTGLVGLQFRIHQVPNGGSIGVGNALYYNVDIDPEDTFVVSFSSILDAVGDFIVVRSVGGATLTYTLSGIQIT